MNIYSRLLGLLPVSRTDVGEVIQVYADGVLVLLQNGGYLRVTGQAAQGSRVFVKNGQIIGPAEVLTGIDIEV